MKITLHKVTYKMMLAEAREQMGPREILLSKLLHIQILENIADWTIKTLLRPYAVLGGGLFAVIGLLVLYNYARFAGFALRGSELLILFTIGWSVGQIIDRLKDRGGN